MSFKIPTADEIQKLKEKPDHQIPSLFKSSKRVSRYEQTSRSSSSSAAPNVTSNKSSDDDQNVKLTTPDKNDDGYYAAENSSDNKYTILQSSAAAQTNNDTSISATTVSKGVVIRPVVESESSVPTVRQPKANSIIVSPKQRGNPVLKCIRNVPWEYGDIVPDYQFSPTSCALFLSVRYHNLKPNYIHERLRQLANSYVLRVLLIQVDVKDCDHALKELAKICILADCTLVLAFTIEEAGRYIETYKSFESKPADTLMEKTESNYMAKITDTLTSVKKVNRTDATTLISAFGSFKNIVEASEQDLSLCPGMGPQKASRIYKVFHQPFLKEPKKLKKETASKDES